jgi:hypothetical protein
MPTLTCALCGIQEVEPIGRFAPETEARLRSLEISAEQIAAGAARTGFCASCRALPQSEREPLAWKAWERMCASLIRADDQIDLRRIDSLRIFPARRKGAMNSAGRRRRSPGDCP